MHCPKARTAQGVVSGKWVLQRTLLIGVGLGLHVHAICQQPILRTLQLPAAVRTNVVQHFAQDASGLLWMGGNNLLINFDGVELHRTLPDESLPNARITALSTLSDGYLWIGHATGHISRYKRGRIEAYEPSEGHPSVPVTAFLRDGRGYVWYGTNGEGLYYDTGTRVFLLDAETTDFPDNSVHAVVADSQGTVFAATDAGFCRLMPEKDGFRVEAFSQTNGLPDNLVKGLALAPDGRLWVATQDSGLVRFDPQTRKFQRPFSWTYGTLHALDEVPGGDLWMATQTGLLQFNPINGQLTLYTVRQGLPASDTRSVFVDGENTVWAGTVSGVGHLLGDRFRFYGRDDGLVSENITSVFTDSGGNYWIGTDTGITRLSQNKDGSPAVRYYLTEPNLPKEARVVVSLEEDSRGQIWAGTYGGGLFRIDPFTHRTERFTTSTEGGLGNDNVFTIARGMGETVWLGTLGGGITRIDLSGSEPRFQSYTSKNGLAGDYVYSVFPAKDGRVYIGTDGTGLSIWNGKAFQNLGEEAGLTAGSIYQIEQAQDGRFFLLTPEQGVLVYDGKTFRLFETLDLSEGREANVLVLDRSGNLMVGREGNLGRFHISDSTANLYDENDGLTGFEPNLNSAYCDRDGIVWIGTARGIVRYNPLANSPTETPPNVVITRFRVFDTEQPLAAGLELRPRENNVTFDFLGVNLTSPNRVRYQYLLEGQDSDWSLQTQSRFVTYPNLPPGKYTFRVRASINPGQWSAQPASYSFEVLPPIWMRWWFLSLSAIGLVAGVYGYFRWRIERVKRENLLLEQKVDERTREVVQQKEIIEAKNEALAEANQNITESIVYASRIQEAILPEVQRINGRLKELMVYYRAKDIVSGDFYWFEQQGNRTFIAAVDCTGHGVPGALLSVMGYNLLNQIAYQHPGVPPDEILRLLDRGLYDSLRRKMAEKAPNDGMDVALCVVDHDLNELQFAGAFRPLYTQRDGELQEIKGSRFPIGGGYEGKEFECHRIPLQPGDRFYIFSDGLVDQFGGPQGRKYTPGRLKRGLTEKAGLPLSELQLFITQDFETWQGTQEQIDDVMLIGFQPF